MDNKKSNLHASTKIVLAPPFPSRYFPHAAQHLNIFLSFLDHVSSPKYVFSLKFGVDSPKQDFWFHHGMANRGFRLKPRSETSPLGSSITSAQHTRRLTHPIKKTQKDFCCRSEVKRYSLLSDDLRYMPLNSLAWKIWEKGGAIYWG